MDGAGSRSALTGGVGLLERAVSYALGSLRLVTPQALVHQTPCAGWDLRALLAHLDDGLVALTEAALLHRVQPAEFAPPPADPVGQVRGHAAQLIGAWVRALPGPVAVGTGPAAMELTAELVATTGAIEVCVHGWDIAVTCGADLPIPVALAADLLEVAPYFVTPADRPARFAAPTALPLAAGPGRQLLAYLGRCPPAG